MMMVSKKVVVSAGYVVIDKTTSTGGVSRTRTLIDDHETVTGGRETRAETKQILDHEAAVKRVQAAANHVRWLCRKYCAWTLLGWLAQEEDLEKLEAELIPAREEAERANTFARGVGSRHRVEVCVVPAEIDLATPDAARQITRTIRTVLAELREAFSTGQPVKLDAPLAKAKSLHRLASGMASECIVLAVEGVKLARSELRTRLRDLPESLREGPDAARIAGEIPIEALESAIGYFANDETIGEGLVDVAMGA